MKNELILNLIELGNFNYLSESEFLRHIETFRRIRREIDEILQKGGLNSCPVEIE